MKQGKYSKFNLSSKLLNMKIESSERVVRFAILAIVIIFFPLTLSKLVEAIAPCGLLH